MGIAIGLFIISAWILHCFYILETVTCSFDSLSMWFHIYVQTYLSVGLFITAHDAMHGTVSLHKKANNTIGWLACFLFAGMSFKRLIKNHMDHHRFPGTEHDPDFDMSQWYISWFLRFMIHYTTISQLVIMGALFNILQLRYSQSSLWLLWALPSLLGALQLFTFGTYLPHRTPHTDQMQPHNARTLTKNHVYAMLTCYFFGYHHEHHESPGTPWWKLYSLKE